MPLWQKHQASKIVSSSKVEHLHRILVTGVSQKKIHLPDVSGVHMSMFGTQLFFTSASSGSTGPGSDVVRMADVAVRMSTELVVNATRPGFVVVVRQSRERENQPEVSGTTNAREAKLP